jgi:hypothetical protein
VKVQVGGTGVGVDVAVAVGGSVGSDVGEATTVGVTTTVSAWPGSKAQATTPTMINVITPKIINHLENSKRRSMLVTSHLFSSIWMKHNATHHIT